MTIEYLPNVRLGELLQWVVIIVGWLIVDHQNNRREHRKETRATIDHLTSRLDALEMDAMTYHQAASADLQLSQRIKLELQRTSQIIKREDLLPHDGRAIRDLRKAITLDNFDTAAFTPQNAGNVLLQEISASKDQLIADLEFAFKARYRRSWLIRPISPLYTRQASSKR